jgi:hypothetical protein
MRVISESGISGDQEDDGRLAAVRNCKLSSVAISARAKSHRRRQRKLMYNSNF